MTRKAVRKKLLEWILWVALATLIYCTWNWYDYGKFGFEDRDTVPGVVVSLFVGIGLAEVLDCVCRQYKRRKFRQ